MNDVVLRAVVMDRDQTRLVSISLPAGTRFETLRLDAAAAISEVNPALAGAPIRTLMYQFRDQPERTEPMLDEEAASLL